MATITNCGCGCSPCSCNCTSCTTVIPTVTTCPPPTTNTQPTMTLQALLDLVNAKCDKTTCDTINASIATLMTDVTTLKTATNGFNAADYQLKANMVASLDGVLTAKYPSATLVKTLLTEIWACVYTRHKHYGEWTANKVTNTVTPSSANNCLVEDNTIATNVVSQVPIDTGDTVTHNGCVYESLVENNTDEPSDLAVTQGKYLNYCDLKKVVDCVLPRTVVGTTVTDGNTICERMALVEKLPTAQFVNDTSGTQSRISAVNFGGDTSVDLKVENITMFKKDRLVSAVVYLELSGFSATLPSAADFTLIYDVGAKVLETLGAGYSIDYILANNAQAYFFNTPVGFPNVRDNGVQQVAQTWNFNNSQLRFYLDNPFGTPNSVSSTVNGIAIGTHITIKLNKD